MRQSHFLFVPFWLSVHHVISLQTQWLSCFFWCVVLFSLLTSSAVKLQFQGYHELPNCMNSILLLNGKQSQLREPALPPHLPEPFSNSTSWSLSPSHYHRSQPLWTLLVVALSCQPHVSSPFVRFQIRKDRWIHVVIYEGNEGHPSSVACSVWRPFDWQQSWHVQVTMLSLQWWCTCLFVNVLKAQVSSLWLALYGMVSDQSHHTYRIHGSVWVSQCCNWHHLLLAHQYQNTESCSLVQVQPELMLLNSL